MAESDPRPFMTASPDEARAPDGVTIYAIGDLHGRADLLEQLIEQIRDDRTGKADRAELIFLGDYIDRGPDSDAVIDQILDLQHDPDFSVTTLKGNHESLALQFLADPAVGPFWCQIGGRQTLLSYGVTPPIGPSDMEQWEEVRQVFEAALPATHHAFLRQLSSYAVRGGYVFVHAGLRPGVKLARQREWDMLWIRREFLNHRGHFEKIVVHGHTPDDKPFFGANRIGIDTGAEETGLLTGLKLVGAERRVMCASVAPLHALDPGRHPAPLLPAPPRPIHPSLSAFALPAAPAGGIAAIPWQRALSPEMWRAYPVLPIGLAALAAIGLVATLLTGVPSDAPPPSVPVRGPDSEVNDLIAQADALLKVPLRGAPAQGTEARTINPAPGPTPTADASRTTMAAAPAAPGARTPAATATPARMPVEPPRTASSLAAPASAAADRAAAGPKQPTPRPDRRRATEIASAIPAAVPRLSDAMTRPAIPDPAAAAEPPPVAFVKSVPIEAVNRIGPSDYPNGAVRDEEEGVVGVRYVVAADGRVSACATIEPSSFVRLNRRTCELIRSRFRFVPALKNGQPVEDVREQRIRWQLSG